MSIECGNSMLGKKKPNLKHDTLKKKMLNQTLLQESMAMRKILTNT